MKVDLDDLITIADLRELFRVSEMTILNWRKMSALETCKVVGLENRQREAVRFSLSMVQRWAKMYNKEIPGLKEWEKRRKGNGSSRADKKSSATS